MDKQKQIEEMEKDINIGFDIAYNNQTSNFSKCIAETLTEKGYCKIPENAVVLSPAERDEEMREIRQDVIDRMNATHKETAEKFAERLKEKDCSIPLKDDFIIIRKTDIDETCKEITEGERDVKTESDSKKDER